ncbi:MAG: hypothetical protein OHK93_005931 [Ramalina farinacea]|uniref:Uncharacterized protein n=1 Tax=Ramalina farinacea TaxID=258253 RepID=A0AA43QKN0_9LECA|nr:hypothetical protein [Ramalina farinacea]
MRSILHSTSLLPLFLLLLLHLLPHVHATQWTVKSYAIETTYTETDDTYPTDSYTGSTTVYLTNLATTPTVTPTSTTSDVSSSSNVTYITYFYPPGAVPQAVLASATQTSTINGFTVTEFYMPIEYTAPASCSSHFTYTSSTIVNVPLGAETQVTPTSTTTSLLNNGDVYETAYLSANAVPLETPPSTTDFDYEYYVARCTNPATTSSYDPYGPSYTGLRSGGDDYSYDYSDGTCLGSLCPFWLIYIIIFCTLIPLLFILGLFESYFWFSRLMKGKYALRGVPIFWVLLSLWALCCLRTSQHAQPQEQAQLEKQWREMGTGTRLSLWFKYGFRHRNPPQIEALKSQTQQQQPMMQQGPPGQQAYYYHPGQQPGQQQAYYPPVGQQQQPYYPPQGAAGSPTPPGQQPYYPPPNQPTNSYYAPPGAPGAGSPPPHGQQQQQAYYPPPVAAQQQPFYNSSPTSPSSPGSLSVQPYQAPLQQQQPQQSGWQQQTRDLAPAEITQPQAVSPVSPSESHGGPSGMPNTHGSAPAGHSYAG